MSLAVLHANELIGLVVVVPGSSTIGVVDGYNTSPVIAPTLRARRWGSGRFEWRLTVVTLGVLKAIAAVACF